MDWVDGIDLASLLAVAGPRTPAVECVAYGPTRLTPHLAAHPGHAVVHGDVKPANLIVTEAAAWCWLTSACPRRPDRLRRGARRGSARQSWRRRRPSRVSDMYSWPRPRHAADRASRRCAARLGRGRPGAGGPPRGGDPPRAGHRSRRRPPTPGELVERLRAGWDGSLPTGVVTFCLTDIVGSTAFWDGPRRHVRRWCARTNWSSRPSKRTGAASSSEGRGRLHGLGIRHGGTRCKGCRRDRSAERRAGRPSSTSGSASGSTPARPSIAAPTTSVPPSIWPRGCAARPSRRDPPVVGHRGARGGELARGVPSRRSARIVAGAARARAGVRGSGAERFNPAPATECPTPGWPLSGRRRRFFFGREEVVAESRPVQHRRSGRGRRVGQRQVVGAPCGTRRRSPGRHDRRGHRVALCAPGPMPRSTHPASPVFFVVDQFEELFTLCRDAAKRRGVPRRAPRPSGGGRHRLRADFYGRLSTTRVRPRGRRPPDPPRSHGRRRSMAGHHRAGPGCGPAARSGPGRRDRRGCRRTGRAAAVVACPPSTWELRDGRTLTLDGYSSRRAWCGGRHRRHRRPNRRDNARRAPRRCSGACSSGSPRSAAASKTPDAASPSTNSSPRAAPRPQSTRILEQLADARLVTLQRRNRRGRPRSPHPRMARAPHLARRRPRRAAPAPPPRRRRPALGRRRPRDIGPLPGDAPRGRTRMGAKANPRPSTQPSAPFSTPASNSPIASAPTRRTKSERKRVRTVACEGSW